MSVEEYKTRYKDQNPSIGWTISQAPKQEKVPTKPATPPPPLSAESFLTEEEEKQFESRFTLLYRQADFDAALEASIRQLVQNEIIIDRYQKFVRDATHKLLHGNRKLSESDQRLLTDAHKVIKDLSTQVLAAMDKMNLTREKKQAQKKSPETTPARLVSGYLQAIARMTPEELLKHREDELEATERLHTNQEKLLNLVPESASGVEDEEQENDG